MSKTVTPTSTSPQSEPQMFAWPALPTETEIYILPDGRVVIADLPAELAALLAQLGQSERCAPPAPNVLSDGHQ
jgi:hypothetical protein